MLQRLVHFRSAHCRLVASYCRLYATHVTNRVQYAEHGLTDREQEQRCKEFHEKYGPNAREFDHTEHSLSRSQMKEEIRKYAPDLDFNTETADLIDESVARACPDPDERHKLQSEIEHEALEHDGKSKDTWMKNVDEETIAQHSSSVLHSGHTESHDSK